MFAYHAEDTFDLFVAQKGRRAAANAVGQAGAVRSDVERAVPFLFKIFDVSIGAALSLVMIFVAAAVVADGVAERNVNVRKAVLFNNPYRANVKL